MVIRTVAQLATGVTSTQDSIMADVLRNILYKRSTLIEVGSKIVKPLTLTDVEAQFEVPNEMTATYPVARAGVTVGSEKVTWWKYNISLEQAQVAFMISDDATLRDMQGQQKRVSIKRAAEAFAKVEDDHIIDTIETGEYSSNTVTIPSGAEWDADSVETNIEKDLVKAWNNILDNSNVIMPELRNIHLLIPTGVYGELLKLKLIGNATQALNKYMAAQFGLNIWPSRHSSLADTAYLMVYGEDTARHATLSTNKIPLVESERRIGAGDYYLTKKYFKCKITPYATGQTTSDRIALIDNVAA